MTDATEATAVNVDGDPTALYRLYDANGTLLYAETGEPS